MSRNLVALRVVFVGLCVTALAVGLSAYVVADVQDANERRLGGQLLVMLLGFPTAFFGAGTLSDMARHFGIQTFDVAAEPLPYVRDWLIVVLLGYAQWFVIVPALWRMVGSAIRGKKKREMAGPGEG